MRKIFTKIALLAFCLFLSFSAKAQEFENGNYKYTILPEPYLTVSVKKFKDTYSSGAVAIPESVAYQSKTYTVTKIGEDAFSDCHMTSVMIPNSVTSIGSSAFYNCMYITSINIPDNVTSIGAYAFGYLALTSITIPDKVTSIGIEAFIGCAKLESVKIGNGINDLPSAMFSECEALATIIIGNSVESISDETFGILGSSCPAIRTIYSQNTAAPYVVAFDQDVYEKATLYIPMGSRESYDSTDGWKEFITVVETFTVGDIIYGNISEAEQTVSVKKYNNNASYKGDVNIPSTVPIDSKDYTVIAIDDNAFESCTGLTSITIPDNVTSIGKSAFMSCIDLRSAKIGNGVAEIKSDMFNGCAALATVTVGNGVKSIGDKAFSGCKAIRTVYSRNMVAPKWTGSTFESEVYSNATLHVREGGAIASYQTTPGWGFTTITEDPKVGVDEVDSQVVKVFAQGGYINVTGAEDNAPIAIYTLQGSLIYSGTCGSTPIEVSGAGLYIARIAGKSYKITAQ